MIAAWMLYAVVTSLLLTAAALAAEHALRRFGHPARSVWVLALLGSLALAAAPWLPAPRPDPVPSTPVAVPAPSGVVASLPELSLSPPDLLTRLDGPLLGLWALASLLTGVVLVTGVIRTRRERRGWSVREVDGHDVLVSDDFGPAVVGVARPAVVVPSWVLALPAESRALVLGHEEEHRRRGDVALLVSAAWAVTLVPWNPFAWIQLRRLRAAVELDCDRRVLRRGAPPLRYADLLLRVGGGPTSLLAPALAEPVSTLERRLRMITSKSSRRSRWAAVGSAAAAALLVAVACEAPQPTEAAKDDGLGLEVGFHAKVTGLRGGAKAAEAEKAAAETGKPISEVEVLEVAEFDVPPEVEIEAPPEAGPVAGTVVTARRIVRGATADGAEPLVMVDGRMVSGVDAVAMEDVESISVLRGKAAEALYGARGRNGAIVITTKAAAAEKAAVGGDSFETSAPPPAPETAADLAAAPTFTPYTVAPDITNRTEVARALERSYPPLLRDAGIGGTARVFFFIGADGRVKDVRLDETSGHDALDEAAMNVARSMEFTPAYNRDERVPVWISLPITFQVR